MARNESAQLDAALRAIRSKCLDCVGGSRALVASCEDQRCPLHGLRISRREAAETVILPGADAPIGVQMDAEQLIKGVTASWDGQDNRLRRAAG